jgi:hypothetical protein
MEDGVAKSVNGSLESRRGRWTVAALLFLLSVTATPAVAQSAAGAPATPPLKYYELRTYYAAPGQLSGVQDEFRSWIIPGLLRVGITPVAYWNKEGEGDGAVVYLMAFSNRAERDAAWARFRADPETAKGRKETQARLGGNPIARSEIVFMVMADFSPKPKTADGVSLE